MRILTAWLLLFHAPCARELSIGTYNVANLFDTRHQEGKNDWEFTPLGTAGKEENCKRQRSSYYRHRCLKTDWNAQALQLKMRSLSASLAGGPYGIPDVLILNEVENEGVFQEWNRSLGYDYAFIAESPDPRGIGNLIAWKAGTGFNATLKDSLHIEGGKHLRPILKVKLVRQKTALFIYAHHWPAQSAPGKLRLLAAHTFAKDVEREREKDPGLLLVSLGDFNVIESNKPHPLKDVFEGQLGLVDLHALSRSSSPGSYFYKKSGRWNRLDRIYVSKSLVDAKGADYAVGSYAIGNHGANSGEYMVTKNGTTSFIKIPQGPSDHFPVFMRLVLPSTQNL